MASDASNPKNESILGTGWGFPPEFVHERGAVRMVDDEKDIEESLRILLGTRRGERMFVPKYGLDMHELVFEATSTTMRALLADRMKTALLIYEPRIDVISLRVDMPDPFAGYVAISIDYEIRATSSRYNLVYPYYLSDSNEVRASVHAQVTKTQRAKKP